VRLFATIYVMPPSLLMSPSYATDFVTFPLFHFACWFTPDGLMDTLTR